MRRARLGESWTGDAYGPWRPAPDPLGVTDPDAFAEAIFRERAAAGNALGCFYLGQMAWKRASDRLDEARRRRGGPETRLRYLDRDRRFLEVPCEEADRWFRRGAAIGGPARGNASARSRGARRRAASLSGPGGCARLPGP